MATRRKKKQNRFYQDSEIRTEIKGAVQKPNLKIRRINSMKPEVRGTMGLPPAPRASSTINGPPCPVRDRRSLHRLPGFNEPLAKNSTLWSFLNARRAPQGEGKHEKKSCLATSIFCQGI